MEEAPKHHQPTATLAALVTLIAVLVTLATIRAPVSAAHAATAHAASTCRIVITGPHWRVGFPGHYRSGSQYIVTAVGTSCSSALPSVRKFTRQKGTHGGETLKGPSGFKCTSESSAASGDKLIYAGICLHPPHNAPFFNWAPRLGR